MTAALIFPAPDGVKGFDANHIVSAADAVLFYAAEYRFGFRYLPREVRAAHDVSEPELDDIIGAKLAAALVQHCDNEGWYPTGELGLAYGKVAAAEAAAAGFLAGGAVFVDDEGVNPNASDGAVMDFLEQWFKPVSDAGYEAGVYVGWHPGVSSKQLYQLPYARFWRAYNGDVIPAARGFQLLQHPIKEDDKVEGVDWFNTDYADVNYAQTDDLGDSLVLVGAFDWVGDVPEAP